MERNLISMEIWNTAGYILPVLHVMDEVVATQQNADLARYEKMRYTALLILRERIRKAYPGEMGRLTVDINLKDDCF